MKETNEKGEYQLWDKGSPIGWEKIDYIDGVMVLTKMKPVIQSLQAAAAKDGIILTLAAGFRPFAKQLALRRQNVIDKTKVNDDHYLLTEPSSAFSPVTAKPGWSNHEDGGAYDFNVTGKPEVYKWLVKNALSFGFIRAVPSERWHWEYRPEVKDQFTIVKHGDPTWDGLV